MNPPTTMHSIAADALRAAAAEVLRGVGSDAREAALVACNLVAANLAGHDSHGVGMLPRYVAAWQEGFLQPNARIAVRIDAGALLALDGGAGFGQSIGVEAMQLAIERAAAHGSCVMALGNVHHLGRIGEWAGMAVAAGLVSVHFVNVISRPIVAPWGGSDARLGTNPFAVGIPVAGGDPVVLDFATSVVAQGKVRMAHNKGEALAPGVLLDAEGRPTTDPKHGVVPPLGALRAFGEHKGFGLALACELLGGALAGGLAVHGPADGRQRVLNGMLTILIDPARLADASLVGSEMRAAIDWVRASPPQPGTDGVRIAGEPERAMRAERLARGIPVDDATWREILAAAVRVGCDPVQMGRLAGLV